MEKNLLIIDQKEKDLFKFNLWTGNESDIKINFFIFLIISFISIILVITLIDNKKFFGAIIISLFFFLCLILDLGIFENYKNPIIFKLDAKNNTLTGPGAFRRAHFKTLTLSELQSVDIVEFTKKVKLVELVHIDPKKRLFIQSFKFNFGYKKVSFRINKIGLYTVEEWYNLLSKLQNFFLQNNHTSVKIPELML